MVVVLPEPLTPITRITCGRGKAPDFQRLGDRREDLLDLLGEDRAKPALVELLELAGGDRFADAVRRLRAEVGGDQRLLDVVEGRGVERGAAGEAGEIVGDLLGSLLETRREGGRASSCPDRRQMVAVAAGDPGEAAFAAPGAARARAARNCRVWPVPSPSISTDRVVPTRLSSQRERRSAAALRAAARHEP